MRRGGVIAPFIGALLALVMFGEPVTLRLIAAAVLMGIGLWLHLSSGTTMNIFTSRPSLATPMSMTSIINTPIRPTIDRASRMSTTMPMPG